MQKDRGNEDAIDLAVRWTPLAVSVDNDHRQEHETEAVVDRAKSAHKAKRIAVSHEKGQGVAPLG